MVRSCSPLQYEGPRVSVLRQKDNKSHLKAIDYLHFTGSASMLPFQHVGWDFANETLPLLSLCPSEKEDGAVYGIQMKEVNIMNSKWSKGRGLLFKEERWILRTTYAKSPATANRFPWLCAPLKVPKFCSRKSFLDSGKKIWESQH